jgi:predicted transcriptional regulator
MLKTSNQLKAARALVGLGQIALAERAALNVNTIRKMEAAGCGPLPGRSVNVQAVQRALEAAGVEFLAGDQLGVRLRGNHSGKI